VVGDRVFNIDYHNFKDSVVESWRKKAYMDIWWVMMKVQELFENKR